MSSVDALRKVLGDTFVMYVHTHIAHWNITGPGFYQYHAFLDSLYNELWDAVDPLAEHIRAENEKVNSTLSALVDPSGLTDRDLGSDWLSIRDGLIVENDTVIASLKEANRLATAEGREGLANFLQERLDKHAKHGWFLRSAA